MAKPKQKERKYCTDYYQKDHFTIQMHFNNTFTYCPQSGLFRHKESNEPTGVFIDNRRCIKIWGKYYLMGDVAYMFKHNAGMKGQLPVFGTLRYKNGNMNDFRAENLTLEDDDDYASEDALKIEVNNKFYLKDDTVMWIKYDNPAGNTNINGPRTITLGGIGYDLDTIKKLLDK